MGGYNDGGTDKYSIHNKDKDIVKSCTTCDYRNFDTCTRYGLYSSVVRRYKSICGDEYENGWVQRRPFLNRLFGINSYNRIW